MAAHATDYYVATNGNDTANGKSVGNAFATIQKGIDEMSSGDTLYIRGGRYHEEVGITNRTGLTIEAYAGEQPVIDGTIPMVGTWTATNLNGHSVWVTSASEDIWQLFVDDRMQVVARWPNVTVGHPCDPIQLKANGHDPVENSWWDIGTWGQMYNVHNDSGVLTNHTAYHDLAAEGLSFSGGSIILNFHSESQFSRNILTHTAGSNALTYEPVVNPHDKGAGPFLIEHLNALDLPGEWWYDQTSGLVWFWPEGGQDPNQLNIRGKSIDYGLSIGGSSSDIEVKNIDFFACTVNAPNQSYLTFDDCLFDYPTWFPRMLGEHTYNMVNGEARMQPLGEGTTRLTDGSNHTIKNCIFRYSDALVDMDDGFQNVVDNNLFHHWSFSGMASFVLNMNSNHESVQRRNTFHTNGSKVMSKHSNCDVEWSRAYWFGYFQNDGTAWQCKGGNGAGGGSDGVRRHHIWHHDAKKVGGRWDGNAGINGTDDHFVSWNAVASLLIKGDYHRVVNNTGLFSHDPTDNMHKIDMGSDTNDVKNGHTITYNNLSDSISATRSGYTPLNGNATNNWNGYHHPDPSDTADKQLRDPKNLDFRPRADSDLIDQGTVVPGLNEDYMGSAPDIGAYEHNCTNYWIPGFQSLEASTPVPPNGSITVKSDADLMWLAGRDSTSHNIYFGTISGALTFSTNQVNNIFEPGELVEGQTYFWRIDEVTPTGTVVGTEWSFTPGTELTTVYQSFTPIADTYAHYDASNATYATQNFGTDTSIKFTSYNNGDVRKHGYMMFDVNVTGQVVSATLNLHNPNGGTVGGLGVYAMTNAAWGESTLTWNNRPEIDGPILDSKDIKTGWSSFFVGEGVSTGLVSFGLIKELGNGNRAISSSETTNSPVLIVEYAADLPDLPAMPQNLTALGGPGNIALSWDASPETYVMGYDVYRTDYIEDDFVKINASLVTSAVYVDTAVIPGQIYYYKVRAVDQYGRQSYGTPWADAVPQTQGGNTPPIFTSNPVVKSVGGQDSSYSGNLADNAVDLDGDSLLFSKLSGPSWLNVATNGVLSGMPGNDDVGLNSWQVEVSDGEDANTATLRITVINVNDAPVFNADPIIGTDGIVGEDYMDTLADDADDMDGDTLTFSKLSGPSWLSVAANGELSGMPDAAGLNIFNVQVSDGNGGSDTAILHIDVAAEPPAGELLAYEGFEYEAGTKIHGLNGGLGFSNVWVSSQNGLSDDHFTIVSDGDSWGDLAVSSNRLQRVSPGGKESLSRVLSGDLGATNLWFSVLWRPNENEGFAIGSGALQEDGSPPDNINGDVGFGFTNADNLNALACIWDASGRHESSGSISISQNTPVLVAGYIEFNVGTSGEDRLSLYPVSTNLTLGSAITVELDVDESTLNTLTIETQAGPGYDEIRIGRTVDDVLPDSSEPPAPVPAYDTWSDEFGLVGAETNYFAQTDTDGMNQLLEYGLGGNPTNDDADAVMPASSMIEIGGTNWMEYVYRRRTDADSRGLAYWLERSTNLVSNIWNTNGYMEVGTGSLEPGFESVTNRVQADDGEQYIRLRISIE
ncbi:CBM96 family carbohydrate-binding protein [Pontiella desulfatans]|nr:DNRLRE domain-containing protein [Pontiella desulfatans]